MPTNTLTKPHLRGGDFSHYQSSATFHSAIKGMKWAALKATEGEHWTDPTLHARWKELGKKVASGQMKLRMAYGFLTPGNGAAQAKHLLNSLGIHGKMPAGTRVALDWESSALAHPQVLKAAANTIHKVTGEWPVVYASHSNVARARQLVPHAPIWDAKWDGPAPKGAKFVQTSDGPGYDHDYFNGTVKDLAKFAGFKTGQKDTAHQTTKPGGLTQADQHANQVIANALKDGPVSENGAAAAALKHMLVLAGMNAGTGRAFDGKVTHALEQFQEARGLDVSGELDRKTFADLKSVEKHVRSGSKTFIAGQKSGQITTAEKQLHALGYKTGKVDGVWDAKDAAGLHAFKVDHQDKETSGALGPTVRTELGQTVSSRNHAPYRVRRQKTDSHVRLDALTTEKAHQDTADGKGIGLGQSGRAVSGVKAHLRYAGFEPGDTSSNFDGPTQAAVKAFQKRSDLPVTGRVDGKTWAALKKTYIYNPNAPMAANEKSGKVKALENDLKKLGHKNVSADGVFDKNTVRAVKQFEKAHHLKQDGVVTQAEAKKIHASLKVAGGGTKAYALAHSLLGKNVEALKYHGPLKGLLDTWVSNHVCCANFVSACYQKVGIFGKKMHQDAVVNLDAELRRDDRFAKVSLAHAKPGDIVTFITSPGEHHTEMFAGWDHGRPMFIGSNNVNADGSQRISISHTRYQIMGVYHYKA